MNTRIYEKKSKEIAEKNRKQFKQKNINITVMIKKRDRTGAK